MTYLEFLRDLKSCMLLCGKPYNALRYPNKKLYDHISKCGKLIPHRLLFSNRGSDLWKEFLTYVGATENRTGRTFILASGTVNVPAVQAALRDLKANLNSARSDYESSRLTRVHLSAENPFPFLVDDEVARHQTGERTNDVNCLHLYKYAGLHGADKWEALEAHPLYEQSARMDWVCPAIASLAGDLPKRPRTFVSLGPGTGKNDVTALQAVAQKGLTVKRYACADISFGLCYRARHAVLESGLRLDVGPIIVGEMEKRVSVIVDGLKSVTERPLMYVSLGNTIGNLEDPSNLLDGLKQCLGTNDSVFLHVSIIDQNYKPDEDIMSRLFKVDDSSTSPKMKELKELFRGFVSFPLVRDQGREDQTEFSLQRFQELVTLEEEEAAGYHEFRFISRKHDHLRPCLLRVRRFRDMLLENYLSDLGFEVEMRSEIGSDGKGHAVYRLTKPT